ncbi:MAG: MBL fold metallo-hydrolase [Geminicoccaceae bacterium]|nr:MAG: MBL fold metallo-hydrolase [Geminicoccaceae bacterium]
MPIRLTFHGGASTVSGSCCLVEHDQGRFLVECGLFEGTRTLRALNHRDPLFSPGSLDFVLLASARPDRAGLAPVLLRGGLRGPIMALESTTDFLGFVLPDLAARLEAEAAERNARARRRGLPETRPLFSRADAARCLERLEACDAGRWFEPGPGVRARFWAAPGELAASAIELLVEEAGGSAQRLLFAGELGTLGPRPPGPEGLDQLVVECTAGSRERSETGGEDPRRTLVREVGEGLAAGGPVLIPAFAGERIRDLLLLLLETIERGELPELPVVLDTPLAAAAIRLFGRHPPEPPGSFEPARLLASRHLVLAETDEATSVVARAEGRAILLAAGGLDEAGRLGRHLREHLWRPQATLLVVGHQPAGGLGQVILSGERRVRVDGEEVAVRARIRRTDALAAHADRRALRDWILERGPVAGSIFLVRGEETAAAALRAELAAAGVDPLRILLPQLDQRFALRRDGPAEPLPGPRRLEPRFASAVADWHNAYARLLLDIADEIRQLPDDRSRLELLGRLRRTLRA